jgi:hypothetical protein
LISAQAGITVTTGQTVNIGTSGTTSPLNIYGDVTIGASGNTTNQKQIVTIYGYNTNKTVSSMDSNTVIKCINNYNVSPSDSTPLMQSLTFASTITWACIAGYSSSLSAGNETCGLIFGTYNAGLGERMRLDYNGCLCIGTTTSSGLLNVGSSTPLTVSTAGLLTVANTSDVSGTSASITTSGGIYCAKQFKCATAATLCSSSGTCNIGATTSVQITSAGVCTIQNTTDTSSPTTGALIVKGGVVVTKALYVGGSGGITTALGAGLTLGTSAGTSTNLIVNGDAIFGTTSNTTNNSQKIQVYGYNTNKSTSAMYSNTVIQLINNYSVSPSDASPCMQVIDFTSDTRAGNANVSWSTIGGYAASLTATSENCGLIFGCTSGGSLGEKMRLDYNGCLCIGTTTSSGLLNVAGAINSSGILTITNTTDATSSSSASVVTSGGIGIAKAINQATTQLTTLSYVTMYNPFGAVNSANNATISASVMTPYSLLQRTNMTGNRTDTLPTATQLTTQWGRGFWILCHNYTAGFTWTIAPDASQTMYGYSTQGTGSTSTIANTTIPAGKMAILVFNHACTGIAVYQP